MVIINQVLLHTYAYIKFLFENYPKSTSYFHRYISLSHVVHSNRQLFLVRKVRADYARALSLKLPIFHHHYWTGMIPVQALSHCEPPGLFYT